MQLMFLEKIWSIKQQHNKSVDEIIIEKHKEEAHFTALTKRTGGGSIPPPPTPLDGDSKFEPFFDSEVYQCGLYFFRGLSSLVLTGINCL